MLIARATLAGGDLQLLSPRRLFFFFRANLVVEAGIILTLTTDLLLRGGIF